MMRISGYILKIVSVDLLGAYGFEVAFFLDETRRFHSSGTCPSAEACFDEAQAFKERILRDDSQTKTQ